MHEAMKEAVGPRIVQTFRYMGIADDTIKEASRTWYPRRRGAPPPERRPSGAWLATYPTPPLVGKCDTLYRSHVVEMIERYMNWQDPRSATRAEVLVALLNTALKAPLVQGGQYLTERLFIDIFGQLPSGEREPVEHEPHAGFFDEELEAARKKLAHPERRWSKP